MLTDKNKIQIILVTQRQSLISKFQIGALNFDVMSIIVITQKLHLNLIQIHDTRLQYNKFIKV